MLFRISIAVVSMMLVVVAAVVAQPECPATCYNCPCSVGAVTCADMGWNQCTDSGYPCTKTPYCGTLAHAGLIFTSKYCASGGRCQVEDIHVTAVCNTIPYTGDIDSCCINP
jgi:hypothetical protein